MKIRVDISIQNAASTPEILTSLLRRLLWERTPKKSCRIVLSGVVDAPVLATVVKAPEKMTEFRMVELEIMGAEVFSLCALRKNLEPMLGPGAFASSQDAGCLLESNAETF
ncbi:hypothetical protein OEA41_009040 [Lepraria neglecta]|uniref:Uncharacterized protein n=1 Tax=Lepraria neglecta TaxID=209136 RepID=A0AAD9Z2H0_9LECA|nr:hypothetical protein OEA41_009040 [Lepraria neglecta]